MLKLKFSIRSLVTGALAAMVFTIAATPALAQGTGSVKGKIRSMAGDRIARATVTARQNAADVKSVTSNEKGEFLLTGLEAGTYNIVFDARGYSTGIKYSVEVKGGKTVDLGDRLIMQVDQGTQVIVRGSVFFKGGTSVPAAKVLVEKIGTDGRALKVTTLMTNLRGEFAFRQPEGPAKFRLTAFYKDAKASKELEVDSAAIYRLAISLDVDRQER